MIVVHAEGPDEVLGFGELAEASSRFAHYLVSEGIKAGDRVAVMLVESEGHRAPGIPVKLAQTPGRAGRRPPRLGEHAREILADAGFDQAAIERLIEAGVVRPQWRESAQR